MSYGRSMSGEFGPEPRPYTACPACGRPTPATFDEDQAYCRWHAHMVPAARSLSEREIASVFGDDALGRAA